MRWLTDRLYRWIDRRDRIPFWAFWIWPWAHWCPEMDDLLILTREDCGNCFCGAVPRTPQ